MNPMREIKIEKITVNIGCGESGEKLEKAKKLLSILTNKKIVVTNTNDRTTFGMAKGRPIGCKITLRGKDADEFLKRALEAVDKRIIVAVMDGELTVKRNRRKGGKLYLVPENDNIESFAVNP